MGPNYTEYTFHTLRVEDKFDIYLAFLDAFQHITENRGMSYQRFSTIYFDTLPCNLEISISATKEDKIVAFLVAGISGKYSAYISLCGVRQADQRCGLLRKMHDLVVDAFQKQGIQQLSLDVSDNNPIGKETFSALGYTFQQKMYGMQRNRAYPRISSLTFRQAARAIDGFPDGLVGLESGPTGVQHYNVYNFDQVVGSVVLQKSRGQIIYINVREEWRMQGIGSSILDEAEARFGCRHVLRIPEGRYFSIARRLGFRKMITQNVMTKEIAT